MILKESFRFEEMEVTQFVFQKIKVCFSDIFAFPTHDLEIFLMGIANGNISYSFSSIDRFIDNYVTSRHVPAPEMKKLLFCAMLEMFSHTPAAQSHMIGDILNYYPEFNLNDKESLDDLPRLLKFRNYVALAFVLGVPKKRTKIFLYSSILRLDGSSQDYNIGGKQKSCVSKRIFIYYQESGQSKQADAFINWSPAPNPAATMQVTDNVTPMPFDERKSVEHACNPHASVFLEEDLMHHCYIRTRTGRLIENPESGEHEMDVSKSVNFLINYRTNSEPLYMNEEQENLLLEDLSPFHGFSDYIPDVLFHR